MSLARKTLLLCATMLMLIAAVLFLYPSAASANDYQIDTDEVKGTVTDVVLDPDVILDVDIDWDGCILFGLLGIGCVLALRKRFRNR